MRLNRSQVTIYKYKKIIEAKTDGVLSITQINTQNIPKKLENFTIIIDSMLKSGIRNCRRIYLDLLEHGYRGSYSSVNSYVRIRKATFSKYKRSVQVITEPGEQAQVDWGYFGEILINGKKMKLYAFVYILSYSRMLYAEFVVRQNQQTFHNCHMNAFKALGVPKKILYDNIKVVVLSRQKLKNGIEIKNFNPAFIDFASYYGFEPDLSPRYWPRSKGKVEASIKYLRNNFAPGILTKQKRDNLKDLNEKLSKWIKYTAQERIHSSTGEKPSERWQKERNSLLFTDGLPDYDTSPFLTRRSNKDGLVQYKANFYSVPDQYIKKELTLHEYNHHGQVELQIFHQGILVALHALSSERGKWIVDNNHILTKVADIHKSKKSRSKKRGLLYTPVQARELNYYDRFIPQK